MIIKFATFIAVTAFALFGAIAEAKVSDSLEGRYDFSDQIVPLLFDQAPSLFGCDVGSSSESARSSGIPSHQGSMLDIFNGNFDILEEKSTADSCDVPIPSPEHFRNLAGL